MGWGDREWQSLEWAMASEILNESEEGLAMSDLSKAVCSSSGSGNEPGELPACLQAELETEMQVSRRGERWGSLCPSATLISAGVLLVLML